MSKIVPTILSCPACKAEKPARLFESLNADRIPAQVEDILAGRFEHTRCVKCGHAFQPQHRMLYAHYSARTWIVMHPPEDRPGFATLERGVALILDKQFGSAPPAVAAGVRAVRPRLVFGQHMLVEAVRTAREGLDAALLECAKLLAVRRDMQRFMSYGPFELRFDRFGDDGALVHAIHSLTSGETLDTVELPADAIAEALAGKDKLSQLYPDLFDKPYISALRYLVGATV